MHVICEKDQFWFLLRDETALYLCAACFHGSTQYSFEMMLNDSEAQQFLSRGDEYIDELAHDVHYSAPGALGSKSIYKNREASRDEQMAMREAIMLWNKRERVPQ